MVVFKKSNLKKMYFICYTQNLTAKAATQQIQHTSYYDSKTAPQIQVLLYSRMWIGRIEYTILCYESTSTEQHCLLKRIHKVITHGIHQNTLNSCVLQIYKNEQMQSQEAVSSRRH